MTAFALSRLSVWQSYDNDLPNEVVGDKPTVPGGSSAVERRPEEPRVIGAIPILPATALSFNGRTLDSDSRNRGFKSSGGLPKHLRQQRQQRHEHLEFQFEGRGRDGTAAVCKTVMSWFDPSTLFQVSRHQRWRRKCGFSLRGEGPWLPTKRGEFDSHNPFHFYRYRPTVGPRLPNPMMCVRLVLPVPIPPFDHGLSHRAFNAAKRVRVP